jgi:hypothetical protein
MPHPYLDTVFFFIFNLCPLQIIGIERPGGIAVGLAIATGAFVRIPTVR